MITKIHWQYFYLFLQAALIELPIYYLMLRKTVPGKLTRSLYESERFLFFVIAVLAINSVSHPPTFFGVMNLKLTYIQNIFIAQATAITIETILIRRLLNLNGWRALLTAFIANAVSWQLAPLITFKIFS